MAEFADEKGRGPRGGEIASNHSSEVTAHEGVAAIEATHKVFGKYSKWALFISLGLAAYIYSLDSQTTSSYQAFATSTFGGHSLISTISVAQAIIVAVGKPIIAKIADVKSRPIAYITVLIFYVVGYIIIASAKGVGAVAGGQVIYSVGYTGLQLLTQVVIADITTLKWRGLVAGLMTSPFIINGFIGSNISANILQGAGWRWGYGMFAILVPAALAPLIVTLLWADRKAKKTGLLIRPQSKDGAPAWSSVLLFFKKLDAMGLLLLATAVSLILLPMTLHFRLRNGWSDPGMIAMLVIGCVFLPVFAMYEWKVARWPVVPRRFVRNRAVFLSAIIGFFDFISFYMSFIYLYSFVLVVKPWTLVNANYFMMTQTISLTVFGILGGVFMRFTRRAKPVLIAGLCIRIVGAGLMIHSRGANAPDVEIVWAQLLQGIGGGFAAVASQVIAQAGVPHSDTASVIAVVLLVTEIGGAIGISIAGAIWNGFMPGLLEEHLPFLDGQARAELFGSLYVVAANPRGDPVREGVIAAYDAVMFKQTLAACIFAIPPLILSLFVPNFYLGDHQNAVEGKDLAGNPLSQTEAPQAEETSLRNEKS